MKKTDGGNKKTNSRFIPGETILSLRKDTKTKNKVAKQIFTISFAFFLLINLSNAQFIQGRNRSVWKNNTKADSVSHNQTVVPETADTSSVNRLSEFIVTATRTEKKINDVGRSVSVISSADIKNSGTNTLAELLSLAEGIYITGTQQDFGANQSLFMRGANSNQSVVLIDGIPVEDPSTPTNALDLSELSLSDIDHVEIVRGSHSTLYGSSAIGGVINIITNKKMKQGLNISASGTAGSFGKETSLISENIGMSYACKGGFYSTLNFTNANVNGIDATVDTTTVSHLPRDKDGMNRFDCGGKLGYRSGRWDLYVAGNSIDKMVDIDSREFTDDNNYTLAFTRKMFSYGLSCKVDSGFIISLNGGKSFLERKALNDSSVVDLAGTYDHSYYEESNKAETFANNLQLNFFRKGFSMVLGGGSDDQTWSQKVYSYSPWGIWQSDLDTLALASRTSNFFMLLDLNGELISEKAKAFSLSLGARSNHNNTFGSSITYQVNPMVKISSTSSLYANFSSGYNAPSLYQLHSPDKDFTSLISRGNINLRPETSVTNEFGICQNINSKTGVRIGYYKTMVNDVIEWVTLWDKNVPVSSLSYSDYRGDTYMNLGTLTTEGVELEAHGNIGNKLTVTGNFSYLRGKYRFSYESVDTVKSEGNQVQISNGGFVSAHDIHSAGLTRRPATANISLAYTPCDKVFFKGVVKYISKKNDVFYDTNIGPGGALAITPVQAYTLVDLISGVKINAQFSGLVRVENIFNVSYSELRGYSARGRGVYVTINYTF